MDVLYQAPGNGGIKVAQGTTSPKQFKTFDFFDTYVITQEEDPNCKAPNKGD